MPGHYGGKMKKKMKKKKRKMPKIRKRR